MIPEIFLLLHLPTDLCLTFLLKMLLLLSSSLTLRSMGMKVSLLFSHCLSTTTFLIKIYIHSEFIQKMEPLKNFYLMPNCLIKSFLLSFLICPLQETLGIYNSSDLISEYQCGFYKESSLIFVLFFSILVNLFDMALEETSVGQKCLVCTCPAHTIKKSNLKFNDYRYLPWFINNTIYKINKTALVVSGNAAANFIAKL